VIGEPARYIRFALMTAERSLIVGTSQTRIISNTEALDWRREETGGQPSKLSAKAPGTF
jgi:hypothetical protein